MMHEQEPPFAIQVELVEGCQLRCSFCGLNGIRGKENNFKFMEYSTFLSLLLQVRKLKWNPRIEFAMHGEPSFHPNLVGMVGLVYDTLPKYHLMLTTNGGGFLKPPGPLKNIENLFDAGLTILALDDYEGVKIIEKIRLQLEGFDRVPVYEYPQDTRGNPHRRGHRFVSFIADISKTATGTHSVLNNHSGSGAPLDFSRIHERCEKPFRELSVRWDGNVAISCNDWEGRFKCGNVVTDGVMAIWNGPRMNAARQKLYHGQRDFGPCYGCNSRGYRTGLLPDKKGLKTLPLPDEETDKFIAEALAGPSYTERVRRPWHV